MRVIDLYEGNAWDPGGDGYIFKAGQGQREYQWRLHASRADLEGKPWGLYWVSDSRYSPESHKAAIKSAFPDGNFGKLGLWIDIEKPYIGMTDAAYRQTPYPYYKPVESLWRGVFAYTGVYPGMYFGPGTWDLIMGATPQALQQEFADNCDCWIAHYTLAHQPDMRGKWVSWAMWQYQGEPDYNQVNPEWWERVVGQAPPPPPPTGDAMITATVNVNGLNFRAAPVSGATSAPALVLGDKVEGDLITADNWMHALKVNGVDRVGYVAAWYLKDIVDNTPVGDAVTGTISLDVNGAVYEGPIILPKK